MLARISFKYQLRNPSDNSFTGVGKITNIYRNDFLDDHETLCVDVFINGKFMTFASGQCYRKCSEDPDDNIKRSQFIECELNFKKFFTIDNKIYIPFDEDKNSLLTEFPFYGHYLIQELI